MERIEKTFEIGVPVHTAYKQWTQLEWDAEITERAPDELIAWRSTSAAPSAGKVRFAPVAPDRTRVSLELEYEPQASAEKADDALGAMSRRIEKAVEDFKREVHGGRDYGPDEMQPPAEPGLGRSRTIR